MEFRIDTDTSPLLLKKICKKNQGCLPNLKENISSRDLLTLIQTHQGQHYEYDLYDLISYHKNVTEEIQQMILENSNYDSGVANAAATSGKASMKILNKLSQHSCEHVREHATLASIKKETHMEFAELLLLMEDKDTSKAFEALKALEKLSEQSNILYPYIDKFVEMTSSEKYVLRVRGFRLFCKQARWDTDYKIDENLTEVLKLLQDEKPTAVRQALTALKDVAIYKKALADELKEKVTCIDYLKYKDTMHSLIAKDIQSLLDTIAKSKEQS